MPEIASHSYVSSAEGVDLAPAKTTAKNTPFETILALKEKHPNITAKNIGKLVGISPQSVLSMFMRHGVNFVTGQVTALEEYKVNRADILAVKQIECLNALSADKLKKASAKDTAMVYGILFDKERLERGQSTVNLAGVFAKAMEGNAPEKQSKTQDIEVQPSNNQDGKILDIEPIDL